MKGIKIFLNRRAVINKVQEMIGSYCTLSKKTNTIPSHVVPTLMKLSLPLKSYFYSLSTFFQNLFTEVAMMLSFLWVDPPLQLMVSTSRSLSATGKNISILCSEWQNISSQCKCPRPPASSWGSFLHRFLTHTGSFTCAMCACKGNCLWFWSYCTGMAAEYGPSAVLTAEL